MARFNSRNYEVSQNPAWVGDWLDEERILRGGAKLDVSAFTPVSGVVHVPSGTLIGRTFAERAGGDHFGPAHQDDDETYLVVFDVRDAVVDNDVDLYRHGSLVKVNYLPGYSDLSASLQALIEANYDTTVGA